ncbi:MAG: hypothetical protein K6A33_11800 [Clostridiales bacterium]|nr:hypothetical protein [Clostridiales bacterium]
MILIGADGGGTKTKLAAFENGVRIAEAHAGPLNVRVLPPEEAARNLTEGLDALGIPWEKIAAAGIADPSLDDAVGEDDEAANAFYRILAGRLPFPVYARSDVFITLEGLTRGGPGTLVIAGTGSMGMARNRAGELRVAGGWGRLTGDEGSGYFIAVRGIRAALRAADGLDRPTALLDALLSHFSVRSARQLIPVLYGEPEPDIAAFAADVARCADDGDPAAALILDDAADRLAEIAALLVRWAECPTVGIWGSVLLRNRRVRERFETSLYASCGEAEITVPSVPAEEAAAEYAHKCMDGSPG